MDTLPVVPSRHAVDDRPEDQRLLLPAGEGYTRLGESLDEVRELLTLMHAHDVEIVTIGQYLRLALVSRASPPGDHHDRVHASIVL
jgi:hypothetical protein